jgi:hypothetical protein
MTDTAAKIAAIKAKIARMGVDYQPGGASKPGHLYNPLPFPDFSDVPSQRSAVAERFDAMRFALPRPFAAKGQKLVDLGCHTGYNSFRFRDLGFSCTGIERDPLTAEIAGDVNALYNLGIDFRQGAVTVDALQAVGPVDVCVFLSLFQWIVLADGFDAATAVLAEAQRLSDVLFFETSMGMEGKFKLPQLPDGAAVAKLLAASGHHAAVDLIAAIEAPDAGGQTQYRLLFRTQKHAPALRPTNPLPKSLLQQVRQQTTSQGTTFVLEKETDLSKRQVFQMASSAGQKAAVKFLTAKDQSLAPLLYREHEFLRAVQHPNLLSYMGHGFLDGTYVLVTEWVEGETLFDLQARDDPRATAPSLKADLLAMQAALKAAGIVHRDVWEKNIIITPEGRAVLLDFGLAAWAHEAAPLPEATRQPDDDKAFAALLERLG